MNLQLKKKTVFSMQALAFSICHAILFQNEGDYFQ